MVPVTDSEPPFDFWSYFEHIPISDFSGYDCSEGQVMHVWRTEDESYEHILIKSEQDSNVFMTIILDLQSAKVHGHHLLDLNEKYSTSSLS
jgi:hypothetical protein